MHTSSFTTSPHVDSACARLMASRRPSLPRFWLLERSGTLARILPPAASTLFRTCTHRLTDAEMDPRGGDTSYICTLNTSIYKRVYKRLYTFYVTRLQILDERSPRSAPRASFAWPSRAAALRGPCRRGSPWDHPGRPPEKNLFLQENVRKHE